MEFIPGQGVSFSVSIAKGLGSKRHWKQQELTSPPAPSPRLSSRLNITGAISQNLCQPVGFNIKTTVTGWVVLSVLFPVEGKKLESEDLHCLVKPLAVGQLSLASIYLDVTCG